MESVFAQLIRIIYLKLNGGSKVPWALSPFQKHTCKKGPGFQATVSFGLGLRVWRTVTRSWVNAAGCRDTLGSGKGFLHFLATLFYDAS